MFQLEISTGSLKLPSIVQITVPSRPCCLKVLGSPTILMIMPSDKVHFSPPFTPLQSAWGRRLTNKDNQVSYEKARQPIIKRGVLEDLAVVFFLFFMLMRYDVKCCPIGSSYR